MGLYVHKQSAVACGSWIHSDGLLCLQRASREQSVGLFSQSVRCGLARCGSDCKCDDGPLNLAPPPLKTSGSRGRQRAAAAQKQVGRASVVFASDIDASWNVQQHSLQRRLTATNLVEAKAAFLEDPTVDPIFEYEHDIEAHQVSSRHLILIILTQSSINPT